MVSQLSSRLFSGNKNSSSGSSSSTKSENTKSQGRSDSTLSGYSADKEGLSVTPPVHIDLNLKHKRKFVDNHDPAKRRKLQELNYAASRVKEDLAKAGLPFPSVRASRPRAIPLAKLNMSSVNLVTSKSVSSSPFLSKSSTGLARHDIATDFGNVYAHLFTMSRPFYGGTPAHNERCRSAQSDTESTSSTSSFSDTESDDSQASSTVMVIAARVEDSLEKTDTTKSKRVPSPTHFISCLPSNSITMEEALGVCDYPR